MLTVRNRPNPQKTTKQLSEPGNVSKGEKKNMWTKTEKAVTSRE